TSGASLGPPNTTAMARAVLARRPMLTRLDSFMRQLVLLRMCHLFRLNQFIKFLTGQKAQLDCRLAQADSLLMSVLGNLSRVVIADMRIQSGDQHQRAAQMFIYLLTIDRHAGD